MRRMIDVNLPLEPFFLTFSASVKFHVVMGPGDLAQAGLDELGEKWG